MPTVTVGNVSITPLQDPAILMDPRQFMPAHAEQFAAECKDQADERGLLPMSVTCYLVRSAGKNILIDTGLGPRRRPGFPRGKLDESLKAAGVDPSEIETIVHTHLHIDHVGWNTVDGRGRQTAGVLHEGAPSRAAEGTRPLDAAAVHGRARERPPGGVRGADDRPGPRGPRQRRGAARRAPDVHPDARPHAGPCGHRHHVRAASARSSLVTRATTRSS